MRKTIREWSATSVSTVGAAASMAIADFRTVSPKIACPAIVCLLYKERQPENGKCSDILRAIFGTGLRRRSEFRCDPRKTVRERDRRKDHREHLLNECIR